MSHLEEKGHLVKWVTLKKVGHTRASGSHLYKKVKLGKMGHACKSRSLLENKSNLQKWVIRGKTGYALKMVQT